MNDILARVYLVPHHYLAKQMEDQDILLQICVRSSDLVLENLSQTTLWLVIREFCTSQHFWYLRTQHLLGRELQQRSGNWKSAYYLLAQPRGVNPFSEEVLSNLLAVEVLVESGFDPSGFNNYAINCASEDGHTEVVKFLLSDDRVDPRSEDSYCILLACRRGHTDIVRLLLSDGRANPSADYNQAIFRSCQEQHLEIIKLLLDDLRVDPTGNNNCVMNLAVERGRIDVLKLLLSHPKIDPTANNSYAIRLATRCGLDEIVKLFDERKLT